ncbi:MAG: hypothetical protein AUI33_10475 [Ignavibacteria bacterium 13_1_40CM_2_61_4]|nr:MAG: hypothetical protein AUI33_10475 [Ignavibacteria bacterium 13_1_40CM_2_61_4]
MRLFAAVIIIVTGVPRVAAAQTRDLDSADLAYFTLHDEAPLSCLLTYFPPLFIQHGIELKSFLRSKAFRQIRERFGDVRALDAVYVRSMQLTDNNTAVALLLSAIASFDHRVVGLKVPILRLYFPLSNESEAEFDRRVENLPSKLYSDTPPGGDHDKLEHFFGSAFLTVAFETEEGADRFGIFVEKGEDAFIVGGVSDERDLRADREGQRFGMALLEDNRRMPSEFLGTEKAPQAAPPDGEPACAGVW